MADTAWSNGCSLMNKFWKIILTKSSLEVQLPRKWGSDGDSWEMLLGAQNGRQKDKGRALHLARRNSILPDNTVCSHRALRKLEHIVHC